MQIDLALFLRLSRTLEQTRGSGSADGGELPDSVGALDRFLLTLDERGELLRARQSVSSDEIEIEVEGVDGIEEAEATPPQVPEEAEAGTRAPESWTRANDLLYEDVLWLFKIGDNEGALVSLGRLVTVAYDTPELKRFVEINESKLSGLYEKILGDFDSTYQLAGNGLGDRYFWDSEEARALLEAAQSQEDISGLLEASPLPRLKTLSLVHRLHTERMIELDVATRARGR